MRSSHKSPPATEVATHTNTNTHRNRERTPSEPPLDEVTSTGAGAEDGNHHAEGRSHADGKAATHVEGRTSHADRKTAQVDGRTTHVDGKPTRVAASERVVEMEGNSGNKNPRQLTASQRRRMRSKSVSTKVAKTQTSRVQSAHQSPTADLRNKEQGTGNKISARANRHSNERAIKTTKNKADASAPSAGTPKGTSKKASVRLNPTPVTSTKSVRPTEKEKSRSHRKNKAAHSRSPTKQTTSKQSKKAKSGSYSERTARAPNIMKKATRRKRSPNSVDKVLNAINFTRAMSPSKQGSTSGTPQQNNELPTYAARRRQLLKIIREGARDQQRSFDSNRAVEETFDEGPTEHFSNMDLEALSPPAVSPRNTGMDVIDINQELSLATDVSRATVSGAKYTCLLLAHLLNFSRLLSLIISCLEFGGFAFYIQYLICLFLIGVPWATMELAIGQFTSLVPQTLFSRIAPSLAGIGLIITLMRLCRSCFEFLYPKSLFFLMKLAIMMFTQEGPCDGNEHFLCRSDTNKPPKCIFGNETVPCLDYKEKLPMKTMIEQLAARSKEATFRKADIYYVGADQNLGICLSVLLIFSISAFLAHSGTRAFAKLSTYIVCLFTISVCLLFWVQYGGLEIGILDCIDYLNLDIRAFYNPYAWLRAFEHVARHFMCGDGTLLNVGSTAHFHNNFLINAIAAAAVLSIFNFGGILLAYPYVHQFVEAGYSNSRIVEMHKSFEYMVPVQQMIITNAMQKAFENYYQAIPAVVIFLTLLLSSIFYVAVTMEMTVHTILHTFPILLSLPQSVLRLSLLYFLVSASYLAMTLSNGRRAPLEPSAELITVLHNSLMTVTWIQIAVLAYGYGTRRLIVNMQTMLFPPGTEIRTPKFLWDFMRVMWAVVIPVALTLYLIQRVIINGYYFFSKDSIFFFATCSIVVAYMTHMIIRYVMEGSPVRAAFRPHPKWGPSVLANRRRALYDEKAARILI